MAECDNAKKNAESCTCTYTACGKRGMCCECLRSHWGRGELPGCLFPADVEKTYDRSVKRFVKAYQERGRWW